MPSKIPSVWQSFLHIEAATNIVDTQCPWHQARHNEGSNWATTPINQYQQVNKSKYSTTPKQNHKLRFNTFKPISK
jgi:hypothetical protein